MKIEINYIDTSVVKQLKPCRYHMADGTIKYYCQTGKGGLQ
jgi:hypothetical protein